ncbi:hypothetical protein FPOA_11821 [Fusarium poae]|uniref:NB-ARC domain-containing protein n=1 Tax=Fusarium poae TaxID=36050 RepID=A0A1B8AHR5_FUSPO|nr:hypothetical protein FPOA_11821 [Fusarium poae]
MNSATTTTQLQPMSIPQQYQIPSLDTTLKLPFDNVNFSQPRLCRGICFSAANAWYSNNHFDADDQCSNLFARAEETKRLLMPELLHIWATASFWDLGVFGKISLADASLAVELRMSGWPKDENGTKMIDLYPTIWLKTADKVVKAKSPWKEIAAVVKRLKLNSPHNAKIFVEGGGRLSDDSFTVAKERLTLDKGINFPSGETLYFHVLTKPGRSSACGLPCLVTIIKDETVLEQNISRIGGLVTSMSLRQAVTSGHVMTKYFLNSCNRNASSEESTDDSAVEMEDSDESEIELVENYGSGHDPEQPLGHIDDVTGLTYWRSVIPSDTINFIIQLSKDKAQTSVWKIDTSRLISTDFALLSHIAEWERDNCYVDPSVQGTPSDTSTRVKKFVSGYHNDASLGQREVIVLVNQESDSLVGSLQPARIPLIVGGATLWTRKLRLQGPLAPGTSGSWVVDRVSGAWCGSIILVYDDEPYALMVTAQALLSDIKTFSSMAADEKIFPTVSESTQDKVQQRKPVVTLKIQCKRSPEDDRMGKTRWPDLPSWPKIQPLTPFKQESTSSFSILEPPPEPSSSLGKLTAWESEITTTKSDTAWTSDHSVKGKHKATNSRSHYLPFPRNENFTGRKGVINELQRLLFTYSYGQRIAIVGEGGVGKTQIALELAHLLKNSIQSHQHYSVIWMPALSLTSFEYACTEMIKVFNIEHVAKTDPKEIFKNFLSSEEAGQWFLVIDNANDIETLCGTSQGTGGITEFIPNCAQGCILFTTQSREIASKVAYTNISELHWMNTKDARALLHNSLVQKDQMQHIAMTDQLLQKLAYLPFAITQAAGYMNINKVTIKEYLQLLQDTSGDMIESLSLGVYGSTDYNTCQGAVIKTCIVSFKQIRVLHKDAARLLSFAACLEPKAIPLALLPRLRSEQSMANAVSTLCSYNFFNQRETVNIFDMHSLVYLACQAWDRSLVRETRAQELVFARLAKVFATDDWEARGVWRQYLPHALRLLRSLDSNRSEEARRLAHWVGRCLSKDGKIRQAIELLEHLVAVEQILPEDHPHRLASEQELAATYRINGQIEDAIQLLEHVVEVQKTLAEDHPDRLVSEHNLASTYHTNGQIEDAIQLLEHVVAVRNTTLAEDHPDRLVSHHNLAFFYRANGQIEDAIQLLEHIVTVQKTTLAEDHPDRLESEKALELCLQDLSSQGTRRKIGC